ncbi:hypothetical protein GRS48_02050 [Halorubrum sp. JWXQ-INN 858]|uniref:hypothetical protein n=1 Tax=Halorubrum sp. JWXQ-INN 858 TaxID=2690782 RepID=UPI0013596D9B|nr:hypothetical protein [Halorubrum sp. JWXQ-INN 858]MWV63610.1 hypothetical protein [Halorubrum sp. JWXQ-INN 858]
MRRKALVAVLLVVVAVGLALSGVLGGTADEPASGEVPAESLIEIDGDHELWPYTSRSTSVEGRTLAINVVFHADGDAVREALTAQPETDWEETDELESDAESDLVVDAVTADWEDAHGSVRYSYFEGPDGGEWVDESFELHDGEYLGARDHVRAYESPDGAYTAVQVHEEYYDWFRLRHTVTHIGDPAVRIEDDFIAATGENVAVDGTAVRREYHGIDGGWSDGWLSVIELAVLIPLAGTLLRRRTREATVDLARRFRSEAGRHADAAMLGTALAAVFLGVRAAGIGMEVAYPGIPPKALAAPLYLAIAVGLPALVVGAAGRCEPTAAFLGVAVGLGAGFVLDFAGLGVAVPPDLIVHRAAMVASLGLVALGRASDDRTILALGLLAWTAGLALPLADVI